MWKAKKEWVFLEQDKQQTWRGEQHRKKDNLKKLADGLKVGLMNINKKWGRSRAMAYVKGVSRNKFHF